MPSHVYLLAWCCALVLPAAPAKECAVSADPEVFGLNFLQTAAQAKPPKTDQCLRFMHIPKTGGTYIDSANLHLPPEQRAYDSLVLRQFLRVAALLHQETPDLGAMFDEAHSSSAAYGRFFDSHPGAKRLIPPGALDACEDLHTPPSRSPALRRYFRDSVSNCATFCVVGEPLRRYLSAFKMFYPDCDAQAIERRTRELLSELAVHPYKNTCMFAPQVEFVYGTSPPTVDGSRYCQRILREENLREEFAALMVEFGRQVQLPETDGMDGWTDCNITVDELTPNTRAAVYEFFEVDYNTFGYSQNA